MGGSFSQGSRDRLRLTVGALGALALHAALAWWFPRVETPAPAARLAGPTMHVRLARRAPAAPAPRAEPSPEAAAPRAVPHPPPEPVKAAVPPPPKPVPKAAPQPVPKPKPVPKPIPKREPSPVAPEPPTAQPERTPAAPEEPAVPAEAGPTAADGPAATAAADDRGAAAESTEGPAVEAPTYDDNPRPDYPRLARRRGLEGTVVLRVYVEPSGRPSSVDVRRSSGHAVLDEAAVEAVRAWRFRPGRRGGRAVGAWVEVPIRFALKDA